jgi:hypothetical protein
MSAPVDRFDEVRRHWIARHQHTFIFQKRRAEILARRIRDRATRNSGARVDPADDDVIHPLLARPVTTTNAGMDLVVVLACAVVAPMGWLVGKGLYHVVERLTPHLLRSYPVAAFMWAAVVVGSPLALLYQPAETLTDTLTDTLMLPWLLAQAPAALLAAGTYGILEGWLAVDGARDWWPLRPPPESDEADFGWDSGDLTLPGLFDVSAQDQVGERTPLRRER